ATADQDDERFARRVGPVLVAEYDRGTAPPSDAAADVVADAVQFLRITGGDAEALAANAVVAVFDEPAKAVNAATRFHLRAMSEETTGRWRAGVHVADLEMTGEGTATLAAVDQATALARVARRGPPAVATDALPVLGRLRDAAVEPLDSVDVPGLPGGSVRLIVPRWSAPVLPRRRMVALIAGAAAVGGTGVLIWMAR